MLACLLPGCSESKASVLSEQYEFDKEGRLIEKISPDNNKIKYKYNNKGFLVEIKYPDDAVRYDYDVNGNRIWMQNKAGKTEYKYDIFGRLIEVVSKYSPVKKIRYGYDPWSRISSIEIFENNRLDYKVEYEYDIFGNLKSINDSTGITRYNYHPEKGEVVRHLPNDIKSIFSYSPVGKLNSLKHLNKDNSLIASYGYEYNSAGKISRVLEKTTEKSEITKYEWDNRGNLNSLHLPDNSRIQYEYDAIGNRISMKDSKGLTTYQYDSYGRHIKTGNIKYEWDNNGNLTGRIEGSSRSRIIYDSRGLPLLVKTPDATIKYSWDGDGNMISRSIGNDTTYYLPDPLAPPGFTLAEYDRAGKLSASYLYGGGLMGQRDIKGHTNYFLKDGFGSVHNMADMRGKITPLQYSTSNYTDLPLSYKLRDRSDRHIARAWELIEKGQRLPMPSQSEINARESYWTEGRYWEEDPYYGTMKKPMRDFIAPKQHKRDNKVVNKTQTFRMRPTLVEQGYFGVPILGLPLKREVEHESPLQFWLKNIVGDKISGKADDTLKMAGQVGHLFTFADPVSNHAFRLFFSQGPLLTWEDAEGYSRAILTTWADVEFGPIGRYASMGAQGIVANLARFYGMRMDRPYWWWSPMKWMSQKEYLRRSEEQAKKQATLAATVVKTRDKTKEAYEGLSESTVSKNVDNRTNKNLLITDLGINQYKKRDDELPFVYGYHIVFRLPSANSDDHSYYKSYETVKQEAYNAVMNYYKENPNVENLELRVLQDVNTIGYLTGKMPHSKAQERADYFTEALLEGVNQAKTELGLTTIGLFASNGGKTFTRGTLSQLSKGNRPLDYMYFDDAQLKADEAEKLINAIGGERIGFLVVRGGFHGAIGGVPTRGNLVSNPKVVKELAQKYDGVELYYFNPPGLFDRPLGLGVGEDRHIYITSHAKKPIQTKIYNSKTKKDGEYKEMTLFNIIQEKVQKINNSGKSDDSNEEKGAKSKKDKKDKDDEKKYPLGCPWCGGSMGGMGGGGSNSSNAGGPPGCQPFCCPPFCGDGGGMGGDPPGCQPFCGDGGMGGMGGPDKKSVDHFKSIEAKLGGIKLDATAQLTGNFGNITGAVYDPEKQIMVLVGDDKDLSLPSIKAEDLAVALMSVFGPIPQDPQFTLDPADPKNARGKWLKAVYIPELIITGTEFGKTLFEADWLLKQYSFGLKIDENNRQQERKSSVPGFKSVAGLSLEAKGDEYGKERWNRFWIVADDQDNDKEHNITLKIASDKKTIYFDKAKMKVESRKIVPDPSSPQGFRDVKNEDDPIATKFANGFTELYDEIAKESPEFERVRQLAKAVAIAKWIKQENIPFDTSWVNEYANKRVPTVGKVTALSAQWENRSQIPFQQGNQTGIQAITQKLYLFGGVDLTVKPKFVKDDGTAQNIQQGVLAKLKEDIAEPVFYIKDKGKSLKAVVLPITHNGQKLWKSPSSPSIITVDGIQYKFNNQNKIVKSIDSDGNVTEYGWDANQRLSEFKTSLNNGWFFSGSKKGGYFEITTINPLKDKFIYKYTPSGKLSEIAINGQKYASMNYKEGEVAVDYTDFAERIKYDSSGRIKRYEVYPHRDDGGFSKAKLEAIDISYDKDGNITEIYNPVTGHIKLAYLNGNIKTLSTTQGKVDYAYDLSTGKIKQINTTWGESAKYSYKGDNLTGITYTNGDYSRDVVFENGLPVKIKDVNNEFRYKFNTNGLLEEVADQTGASGSFLYDEQNRIKKLTLPDGSSTNIQYEGHYSKDAEDVALKKIKVVRIPSKRSSSPITKKESASTEGVKDTPAALASRLEDIKEAGKNLRNGAIIDLFAEGKDVVHGNIAGAGGEIRRIDNETTKELRRLLNITATSQGNLGNTILKGWGKFYDANLSSLVKPVSWTSPDGKTVKLKPLLIIKSNEVTYKYANLERVPVLADNFIIFIASKTEDAKDAPETSAKEIVSKINNIPKLTQKNAAFIIRLPKMNMSEQAKWDKEINNLQKLVGKDNVLIDPSKNELNSMLQNKGKDIIAIELTHTDNGILLKNGARYTSKDINQGGDLSHIKYLISGHGTCSLPRIEEGKFIASLKKKKMGIINASYRKVSSETALKKLKELINILDNIKEYDLYPYHLFDIINQKLGVTDEGTTNMGKNELQKVYLFG
ncbi:hypothetical protein HY990_00040 [Candidatus Micrarchaeota archaeon]|nr:hypothetical protein [Candidatus Micrarchaeota archaeon]